MHLSETDLNSGAPLRLVLNAVADPVSIIDSNWRLVFSNAAAAKLLAELGVDPDGAGNGQIWESLPGLSGTPIEAEFRRAVQDQQRRTFNMFYAPLERWFEIRCFPAGSNLLTFSRDITTQRYRERLATLRNEVATLLSTRDPVQAIMQRTTELIVTHVEAAFARIWLLNHATNVLELNASAGMYTHLDGPHGRVPVGQFKIGRIAQKKEPHLTNDVPNDPHVSNQEWARREGMVAFAGYPLLVEDRVLGVLALFAKHKLSPEVFQDLSPLAGALAQFIDRRNHEDALLAQTNNLKILNSIGSTLTAELEVERLLQTVTDEATKIVRAQFGAFFYNALSDAGEAYTLYTLSGAPREAFSRFGMPRATQLFGPTFKGEGIIRLDDVRQDPRYGKMSPHYGMPKGHLPVVSYLAAPVVSRSGEVLGGLFFGHPEPGRFGPEAEEFIKGIAAQAAVAIDNARLFAAAQREIAQRKEAEEALRRSEERFRRLYDSNIVGVAFLTLDGWVLEANDAYLSIAGFTREEFQKVGRLNWRDLTPLEARGAEEVALDQLRLRGAFEIHEKEWVRRDGSRVFVAVGLAMLQNSEQDAVAVALDITERKQMERDLAEAQERLKEHAFALERRVQERTAKLQDTIQSLERFTYSIAHDLRSPLRGMAGLSYALLKDYSGKLDSTAVDYASRILGSAKRMDALIQDLLGYARLTQVEVPISILSLDEQVARTIDQLESEVERSGGVIKVRSPLGSAAANAAILEQILLNLISNALKFVPDSRKAEVLVYTEEADETITLYVKDNGIGIAPEHHERIFRVFERLNTEKRYPGTGIGLAVVQKGAERLGGVVGVESEEGNGSTFWVRLPIRAPKNANEYGSNESNARLSSAAG